MTEKAINVRTFAIGDSIAVGLNSVLGVDMNPDRETSKIDEHIFAKQGIDPSHVHNNIVSIVNRFILNGKNIFLSSGLSNDPRQIDVVKLQIAELKTYGANIVLIGIGKTYNIAGQTGRELNEKLAEIAASQDIPFAGGFVAGPDGAHPTSYFPLRDAAVALLPRKA